MEFHKKYSPLFELIDESRLKKIDTVIITGGRGSGKSYTTAILIALGVVKSFWKILYSRFTATSIGDSIREEVYGAIDDLNLDGDLIKFKNQLYDKNKTIRISFKGLKTGSKNQKANLKSIKGFNVWVLDEAEECPDFKTFQRIFLSIRHKDKRNLSILILNPTYKQHWIFRKFYKERNVPAGFNGAKDNILYIHTSYLDLPKESLPENILNEYQRIKKYDPRMYNNIVMGGWLDRPEGSLFPSESLNYYDRFDKAQATATLVAIDPAGDGNDSTAAIVGYLVNGKIYIDEVIHEKQGTDVTLGLVSDLINRHKCDYARIETNMANGMYMNEIRNRTDDDIAILPVRSTTNKHERIISISWFIKKFFVFRKTMNDEYYQSFMNEILLYSKNRKENDHDDAPDSCEMLGSMFRDFYPDSFENS